LKKLKNNQREKQQERRIKKEEKEDFHPVHFQTTRNNYETWVLGHFSFLSFFCF
jgi:hypothetical protein